jgi:class 3 adenylate cyclase
MHDVPKLDLDGLPSPGGPSKYVSIMVIDVVGFGRRQNNAQSQVRRGLYGIVEDEFDRSEIAWNRCYYGDRGDGILIIVPAMFCTIRLVDPLLDNLSAALQSHNRLLVQEAQIRLRIALHVGPVQRDTKGLFGKDVILPFRLLDASALRDPAFCHRDVAFIASDDLYENVLRHEDHQADYKCVNVEVKETNTCAWVRVRR